MVIMTVLMVFFLCSIGIIITFYSLFRRQESLRAEDRERALSRLQFEREHHDALKVPRFHVESVEKSGDLKEMSNINEQSQVSKVYKALVGYDYDAEDEDSLDRLGVEYDDGSFEVIESMEITAGNELNRTHSSSFSELQWPLLQGMTIMVDDYDVHYRGQTEGDLAMPGGDSRRPTTEWSVDAPESDRASSLSVYAPGQGIHTTLIPGQLRPTHGGGDSISGELSLPEGVYEK